MGVAKIVKLDGEQPMLEVEVSKSEVHEIVRALWIANQRLLDNSDKAVFETLWNTWRDHLELFENTPAEKVDDGGVYPVVASVSRTYDPQSYVEYVQADGDTPTQDGFLLWLDVENDFNGGSYNDPDIRVDRQIRPS